MTNTLERFRIALAMQRSCFSLRICPHELRDRLDSGANDYVPSGKVLAAFGNGGLEVPENIEIDRLWRLFRNVFGRDQMHTTERFELIEIFSPCHERRR